MSDDIEIEDRGTPCVIWWDVPTNSYAFNWFPGATPETVSVPVGWSLFAHPHAGAVLRNVFGRMLTPESAAGCAREGRDGFRVRKESP